MKEEDGRPGPRPDHLCADAKEALAPVRVQLSRAKGFNLQAASRAINGLQCVKVDRSTKWGNPFIPGKPCAYTGGRPVQDKRHAFSLYRAIAPDNEALAAAARAELRGKNLACWCPVEAYWQDGCCHADVLLGLANGGSATIGVAPQVEVTDPGRNPESSTEMEARKNR